MKKVIGTKVSMLFWRRAYQLRQLGNPSCFSEASAVCRSVTNLFSVIHLIYAMHGGRSKVAPAVPNFSTAV